MHSSDIYANKSNSFHTMSPPECYAMKTSSQPRISNRPPVATTQELQMTPETLQQDYMAVLQRDENHLRFLPKQHILPSTLPNWRPCPVCNCNLGMASGLVFGFLHRQDSLQGSTLVFLHPHVAKSRSSKKDNLESLPCFLSPSPPRSPRCNTGPEGGRVLRYYKRRCCGDRDDERETHPTCPHSKIVVGGTFRNFCL